MNLSHIHARSASMDAELPVVHIIDNDPAASYTLERLLRSAGWQTNTFVSAEEFLAQPRHMAAGCLVVEQHLPGISGLELQKLIADRHELPVIFMSSTPDVHSTVQAMKAGAIEFLTKPFVGDVLLHAIGYALGRSQQALRQIAEARALQDRYDSLSRREREVMHLVVAGRLNKQVGGELGISEITVKAHRGKMMRKMRAASFAHLVNMVASLRSDFADPLSA